MVAAHQDAAPERPAAGEAVDPGDGVAAEALLLLEAREDLFEVLPAPLDDAHPRRLERQERQARGEDDAGQPHAADRGVEGLGVLRGGAAERLARGEEERQLVDVAADRPVDVVVLAVDVGRERAADGDEAGARDDREEEAARKQEREEPRERRAPLAGEGPPLRVEREDPLEPLGQDDGAGAVQRRVAVAPPEPAQGERRLRGGADGRGDGAPRLGAVGGPRLDGEAPPAREGEAGRAEGEVAAARGGRGAIGGGVGRAAQPRDDRRAPRPQPRSSRSAAAASRAIFTA